MITDCPGDPLEGSVADGDDVVVAELSPRQDGPGGETAVPEGKEDLVPD